MRLPRRCHYFLIALCIATSAVASEALRQSVDGLIAGDQPPSGVVFEVVTGSDDYLDRAVPAIRAAAARLRERFAGLPLAVVTHGIEQFALTSDRRSDHQPLHETVKLLNLSDQIPVHVCGTHAGWHDLGPEAFPDYVDVAPSGPAQIANYLELGYVLIEVVPD